MKKTYIEPSVMVASIATVTFICGSQDLASGGDVDGIGYGGVDEEGELDPASRRHRRDVWDDEEEEEYLEDF